MPFYHFVFKSKFYIRLYPVSFIFPFVLYSAKNNRKMDSSKKKKRSSSKPSKGNPTSIFLQESSSLSQLLCTKIKRQYRLLQIYVLFASNTIIKLPSSMQSLIHNFLYTSSLGWYFLSQTHTLQPPSPHSKPHTDRSSIPILQLSLPYSYANHSFKKNKY